MTDHVPHLCPTCDGPMTAGGYCTKCDKQVPADEMSVKTRVREDRSEGQGEKEPVTERVIAKLPGRLGERIRDKFRSDSSS